MLSIESTAKTVKQAIEDGLKKLNKTIDEVEVKIISQPGIFRKAKVLITVEGLEPPKPEIKQEVPAATPQPSRQEKPADKKPEREQSSRREKPATENKGEGREDRHSHDKKDRQRGNEKQAKDGQGQDKTQEPRSAAAQKNQSEPQQKDGNKTDGQREPYQKNDFLRRGNNKDRFDKKTDERRERDSRDTEQKEHRERRDRDTEPREHKEREYREITDEAATVAADFVDGLLSRMNVPYSMLRKRENGALILDITSESGTIIGYRGETLDSIEYLASLTINRNSDKYYKISVDCNGYRIKREEMLAAMAVRLAEKAVRTQRKVIMESMNNFSRKVVHSALADNDKIFTRSEGVEPNRHIVIIPKRNKMTNDK